MNNIWFWSDTHFNHKNILAYEPSRHFDSVEEMNQALVNAWNSTVAQNDAIYFLGDLAMGRHEDIVSIFQQLHGNIHLVVGNHDDTKTRNLPWSSVETLTELKVSKRLFVLCHYPLEVWNRGHYGSFHLHGHSHGHSFKTGRRMDVGVDALPFFRPIHMDEVVEILDKEIYEPRDHHTRE